LWLWLWLWPHVTINYRVGIGVSTNIRHTSRPHVKDKSNSLGQTATQFVSNGNSICVKLQMCENMA
jgi:hypothetical protein